MILNPKTLVLIWALQRSGQQMLENVPTGGGSGLLSIRLSVVFLKNATMYHVKNEICISQCLAMVTWLLTNQ